MTKAPPTDPDVVLPVAEARSALSVMLRNFRELGPDATPVVIGSHRRPEAVLIPYERFVSSQLAAGQETAARPGPRGHRLLDDLRRRRAVIERLARANRISSVQVFGSVARGDETPSSDVDLLVDPQDDASLFDIAQFELDMESLFERAVDVVSRRSLDADRDRAVLDEAIDL
ncbi:nucleotidyltransferase domain-containing protein [Agromyces sp. ISL-38]|uniref:nucleotidyltransferase family protein n=1 Tax=Agromyces sp. ISL-38 TaxID=2819107 RepID=UPI001BE6E697|nr:nucleotidyltransferase domain-containing protein [Agromyces sp. ISL-38]MBT2499338.1 nucleotidyltransferase domain-containing protein [Agromyces sp. ISL-38]MBT2518125.1 nucleotidyltransferase domain-containing protein [Streptomyces sp. ISL-90]